MALFDFASWLRQAFLRSNRNNKKARRTRTSRLRLEQLEDRVTPSVTDLTQHTIWATIQDAVNNATIGDTILADAGTYSEKVTINKTLTLEGAQHGMDARTRSGAESIVTGAGNSGFTPFNVTANNVIIDGFTVEGATNSNAFGFGILVGAGTSGTHVVNNIVQNNIAGLSLANNSTTSQTVIQHNLFNNNNQPGPGSGDGIYSDQFNAGGTLTNVLIDSNTFTGNSDAGIDFSSTDATKPATSVTISNNDFNGNARGMLAFDLTNSSITSNTFENSTSSATADIRLFEGVNGLTITGNLLKNGAGRAVRINNEGSFPSLANPTNIRFALNSISGYTGPAGTFEVDNYTGTLDASCNWWGAISGPTIASNPGGLGQTIVDPNHQVAYRTWLIYGTDANPAAPGFQLPTTINVSAGGDVSAADNDYTRLANAVGCVQSGQTLVLSGTFDWTKPLSSAAWAKGNDGVAGTADDYTIYGPANVNNVTLTAASLGAATIQGPGSIPNLYLEGPLQLNTGNNADRAYGSSTNQNWTISNLNIFDFALGIAMFDNPGGNSAAFSGTHIVNNHIRLAPDVLDTVTPANTIQNIGVYYSFGQNQVIQNNTIDLQGDGVSDSAHGNFAAEVGMQGDTSGGNVYNGLLIDSNTVNVLHAQSSNPERIRGIWENTDGATSNITVSNNKVLNLAAGNDPSLNLQIAFRLTSPSSATTTILYQDNQVDGANVGFQYYPGYVNTGTPPVRLIGNTLTHVHNGFDFSNAKTVDYLSGNSVTGTGSAGAGVAVGTGSTLTTDGLSGANHISGFATGVDVNGGSAGLLQNTITGNTTGVSVENGGALTSVTQNFITGNTTGVAVASGAGAIGMIFDNDLSGNTTAIANSSGVLIDASGNWWGVATSAGVRATFTGLVDYTPFLVSGADAVTPGFQGDFSVLDVDAQSQQSGSTGRIQEGVADVTAGGTVNVLAGTYAENVTISKDLTLAGVSGSPTAAVIQPTSNSGAGVTVTSPAAAVTVRDLKITGANNGLNVSGLTTLNLADLVLMGNTAGGTISGVNTVNETPSSGSTPTNVTVADYSFASDLNQSLSLSNILFFIVFGSTGSDTFNVTPSHTTTFTIHGNNPTPPASPGDTLIVPGGGALADTNGPTGYSGAWTFSGDKPVNFDGIETLKPTADLTVTQTASATPTENSNLTFSITVTNNGPNGAQNVLLTDAIPAGTTFVSSTFTAYTASNNTVNLGTITPGNHVTGTITVFPNEESTVSNTALAVSDLPDPNPGDNTNTLQVTVTDPAVVAAAGPQINAVEGGSTNFVVLASFTDPAGAEPLAEYDATVNWGDGGSAENTSDPNSNVFIVQAGHGRFLVEGTHVYGKESPAGGFTVTTTIHHHSELGVDVDTVVTTQKAVVTDPALSATGGFTYTTTEGADPTSQTLATFTDPAGAELDPNQMNPTPAPGAYTATVNWGDGGAPDTSTTITVDANGLFTVAGTHRYSDEGTYTVSVQLQHGTAPSLTVISKAVVADAVISVADNANNFPTTGAEGASIGPVANIATITDNHPGSVYSEGLGGDFSAVIFWGDGTTSPGAVSYASSGGVVTYRVDAPAHTYAEDGRYTVQVQAIHDKAASVISNGQTITIGDVAVNTPTVTTLNATENVATAANLVVATFGDPAGAAANEPASDFSATINWGDATATETSTGNSPTVQVVALGGGQYQVVSTPGHTYADDGAKTITVAVTHGGLTSTGTGAALVADKQITGLTLFAPTAGTEGANIGATNRQVAVFTDPAGAHTANDAFTASVNWGDGSTSAATLIQTNIPGQYTVNVASDHAYSEEGNYTLSVTVQHGALSPVSASQQVTIADAALASASADLTAPAVATEGGSVSGQTLLHFTDANSGGKAGDYTATVNWGDGAVNTSADGSGTVAVVADTVNGGFKVVGGHAYAEELSGGTFKVTVKDAGGSATSQNTSISVADAALTVTAATPAAAVEGVSTGVIRVATFTDADPAGTASDYHATIHWGDGTADTAGTVVDLGGGSFGVTGAHAYAEEGAQQDAFSVTVTDAGGATKTVTGAVVNAADAPLTVTQVLAPANPVEAAVTGVVTVATFSDADLGGAVGDYTATIQWGDGTSGGTVVDNHDGTFGVTGSHTYAEEGATTNPFSVTVTDTAGGASDTRIGNKVVASDPAVSATGGFTFNAVEGKTPAAAQTVATFTDPANPAGSLESGDYSATIDWGDGTAATNGAVTHVGGAFTVKDQLDHLYAEEGTYQVRVTLHHDAAPDVAVTSTAVVSDPNLPSVADLTANVPSGVVEGQAIAPTADLAEFTDPGGQGKENVGDFTATVLWGDGLTSPGTVVSLGNGKYRVDAPGHAYAEENAAGYNVQVRVSHDGQAAVTSTGQFVTVSDPAVSNPAVAALSAVEGAPTAANLVVATFSDPAGTGAESAAADFAATINWGDTQPTDTGAAVQVVSLGNGQYQVVSVGGHTYAEDGAKTVTVAVTHGGLTSTGTGAATVADQQLTALSGVTAALPATGLEGAAIKGGGITGIVTFTDPGGPELAAGLADPGAYTAVVNWGDGKSDAGAVVYTGGNNFRVDAPDHTYAEEGNYTVSVGVAHDGQPMLTAAGRSVSVADQAISTPVIVLAATEGIATGPNTPVATFNDPAGFGVEQSTADFTAVIDWGDKTSQTTGFVVALSGGNYQVVAPFGHTYAEEGPYTVTAVVAHDNTGSTLVSHTVNVTDAALTNLVSSAAALPTNAVENAATGALTGLATFTDPGGSESVTDYTATINWGDGAAADPAQVVSLGNGNYRVDAPNGHFFKDDGIYPVTVSVAHDGLTAVSALSRNITIGDPQVTSLADGTAPTGVVEGTPTGAVTGLATFTDPAGVGQETPAGDFTATINWGDGVTADPAQVVSLGNGNYRVDSSAGHTYQEEGNDTISVSVKHDALAVQTTAGRMIAVTDAALTAGALTPPLALEATPFTDQPLLHFTDADLFAAAGDFTALIRWGDGTTDTVSSIHGAAGQIVANGGGFDVLGSHTYSEEPPGPLSVKVTDNTATATAAAAATVSEDGLPFTDNFMGSGPLNITNWRTQIGGFNQSGGRVSGTNPIGLMMNVAAYLGASETDVSVHAAGVDVTAANAFINLYARYSGAPNGSYYYASLFNDGAGNFFAGVYRHDATGYHTLAVSQKLTPTPTNRADLVFTVQGNALTVSVNGAVAVVAFDGALTGPGQVAFGGTTPFSLQSLTASSAFAALPFTDNFGGSGALNSATWQTQTGGFNQAGGAATGTNAFFNLAAYTGASAADVSVHATGVDVTAANAFINLYARYSGDANGSYYYASLFNDGAGHFFAGVYRHDATGYHTLPGGLQAITAPGAAADLRFDVLGNTLTVSVNGASVVTVSDGALTAPGLVAFGGPAPFRLHGFTASAAFAAVPFSRNFSDGFGGSGALNSSNWQTQTGGFNQANGRAATTGVGFGLAAYTGAPAADVSLLASGVDVTAPSAFIDLFARYSGSMSGTYYYASLFNDGAGNFFVGVYRHDGTGYHTLTAGGQAVVTPFLTNRADLRFDVVGSSLKVFVNDILYASVTDGALTAAGQVALGGAGPFSLDAFDVTEV